MSRYWAIESGGDQTGRGVDSLMIYCGCGGVTAM
jgi:hypothetical protein